MASETLAHVVPDMAVLGLGATTVLEATLEREHLDTIVRRLELIGAEMVTLLPRPDAATD